MKLLLNLLLSACTTSAYLSSSPSFLVHRRHHTINQPSRPNTSLYYKEPGSSSSNDGSDNSSANVWSVLANTEKWISDTLDKSNKAANARRDAAKLEEEQQKQKQMEDELEQKINMHFADPKQSPNNNEEKKKKKLSLSQAKDNPYVRKEVSYVCEVGTDLPSVVGGIFRRVKEARELGEAHGRDVEIRLGDSPSSSQPTTMRQTNVVVIPNANELQSFQNFDKLVMAINQARRSARDFVLKKKDDDEDDGKEWTVSINCAHLHPQYGMQTPEEQLAELKRDEEEGEVDVNMQEYKKRRDEARRSPYPSVIVEVQSTPPPDFGTRRDEAAMMEAAAADMMGAKMSDNSDGDVTSEDVKKLEALFGLSAAKKSTKPDDPFYDALGEAFGNKQVISQTPLQQAQNWVLQNDPAFNEETSTFTKSDTRHVDSAYEYIFNTIAMLNAVDENTTAPNDKPKRGQKSYVVLPNFLPTSATSFDRFAGQVSNILRVMPSMSEKAMLSTFHPEHVVGSTQSPVPVLVITWK